MILLLFLEFAVSFDVKARPRIHVGVQARGWRRFLFWIWWIYRWVFPPRHGVRLHVTVIGVVFAGHFHLRLGNLQLPDVLLWVILFHFAKPMENCLLLFAMFLLLFPNANILITTLAEKLSMLRYVKFKLYAWDVGVHVLFSIESLQPLSTVSLNPLFLNHSLLFLLLELFFQEVAEVFFDCRPRGWRLHSASKAANRTICISLISLIQELPDFGVDLCLRCSRQFLLELLMLIFKLADFVHRSDFESIHLVLIGSWANSKCV